MRVKHKVIFDTDPGVDDAMALYFALAHPDIEVLGITTVFGNVTVDQAAINALYLTRIAGYAIPVAKGAGVPLAKPFPVRRRPAARPNTSSAWRARIPAKSRWWRWRR